MPELCRQRYETARVAFEQGYTIVASARSGGRLAHRPVARKVCESTRRALPPATALLTVSCGARRWSGRVEPTKRALADAAPYRQSPSVGVGVGKLATLRHVVLRGAVRAAA